VFDCADGHVIIATGNDAQYRRLCGSSGCEDLADHPAYRTTPTGSRAATR
jgi:crotonobetainyl-CoA:carnitine CoA-transferase CaiB-like acyl-CoA transferase